MVAPMLPNSFDPIALFPSSPIILLAEEDANDRARLASALAHDGNRVIALEDGLELFDYLVLSGRGRLPRPKVIVSDLALSGCTGIDACRRAGPEFLRVPFILLAEPSKNAVFQSRGIDEVILKPVDEDELCEVVALHSN